MTDETRLAAEPGGQAASRGAARAQKVLVVDDETGARDLMARWLESSGYTVTTAASAEEALGRLQDQPSAVALCDIRSRLAGSGFAKP